MGLELIPAYGRQEEITTLFTEYTDMLMEADPTVRQYLILQHYEKELERPESKYGMPEGRLYLAYWDGRLAGCIGLRKLDEERGELKRLYVRSDFRGHQIGEHAFLRTPARSAIGMCCWIRSPSSTPPYVFTGRLAFTRLTATTTARWRPPSFCNTTYKEQVYGYHTGLYRIRLRTSAGLR